MGNQIGSKRRPLRILMQGLNSAGKTTILYKLKLDEFVETEHTISQTYENIKHSDKHIMIWDVGAREDIRVFYRYHYRFTDALVFVIDSSYKENFSEVKEELERVMEEESLKNCPFVILANKQDVPGAMTKDEIVERLDLQNIKAARGKKWVVFQTSALTGEGFSDVLDWITNHKKTKDSEEGKQIDKGYEDIAFYKKCALKMRSFLLD